MSLVIKVSEYDNWNDLKSTQEYLCLAVELENTYWNILLLEFLPVYILSYIYMDEW